MNTKFADIASLRNSIVSGVSADYRAKMYQPVPEMPTIKDRAAYLVEKAKDKIVLDVGCTGPISQAIRKVAKAYYGVDKVAADGIEACDLELRPDRMPVHEDVEIIICAEILEHLGNPGYFLLALKKHYHGKEIYFTVPNAGAYQVRDNCELVNAEHVCWYSYATIASLLKRYQFEIIASRWYNGEPYKAEGIIMVAK